MAEQSAHQQPLQSIPDLVGLHRRRPDRYPFLLQSTAEHAGTGRYDILFAFPGETLQLEALGQLRGPGSERGGSFVDALDAWWRSLSTDSPRPGPQRLPFTGGWFVYAGYELAGELEPSLRLPTDPHSVSLPMAFATRCPAAVVVDRLAGAAWAVSEPDAREQLDEMLADLARPSSDPGVLPSCELDEPPPEDHFRAVRRAQRYIGQGDIFQANLSREWRGRFSAPVAPADLYRAVSASNPGPFAGLALWGETAIVSSSPERLIRVQDDWAETRPIAGTRHRDADATRDQSLSSELLMHPKERAEHVMLIDLERNDLGRVCVPGTVTVDEMMVIESYAHVHHIVSNVRGRLTPGTPPGRVLRALFPGGTITGCPKVRCMAIIAELEGLPRGPYTGSMGYLNRDGRMDLNILIRTLALQDRSLSFRTGGGVVADSDPESEVAETRAKARGLLGALEPVSGREAE